MDESKDKPITDKENFPPSTVTEGEEIKMTVAYLDGLSNGYRKCVNDFLMWLIAFALLAMLFRISFPE
jgi:hypothetical protein